MFRAAQEEVKIVEQQFQQQVQRAWYKDGKNITILALIIAILVLAIGKTKFNFPTELLWFGGFIFLVYLGYLIWFNSKKGLNWFKVVDKVKKDWLKHRGLNGLPSLKYLDGVQITPTELLLQDRKNGFTMKAHALTGLISPEIIPLHYAKQDLNLKTVLPLLQREFQQANLRDFLEDQGLVPQKQSVGETIAPKMQNY